VPPCIATSGYGGLGASASVFDANNNGTVGQGQPTPGAAWYQVIGTKRGCVIAYTVQESGSPPRRARDMLTLVTRAYLPGGAKQVGDGKDCVIWKSQALKHAVGLPYVRAIASAQSAAFPGAALIEAMSRSACTLY
jgi:hypothetical protein